MKLVTVLSMTVMLVLLACGGGALPEDSMKAFVDAVKSGDGATAASYISSYALSELDVQLVAIKENPEMSVTYLEAMGVETTANEISDWTSVFRQANVNRWFASESCVLSPVSNPSVRVITKAQKKGIGIYSMPSGLCAKIIQKPERSGGLPVSYASWMFNEWIGRQLLRKQGRL